MSNLGKDGENKLVKSILDILTTNKDGFNSGKNEKDNTEVSPHIDTVKRVDEIIAGYENHIEPGVENSLSEIIEDRQSFSKKPERPAYNTNLSPDLVTFEVIPERNDPMDDFVEKTTSSMTLDDLNLAMSSTLKTGQPKTEKVKQKSANPDKQLLDLREQSKNLKEEERQLQKEEQTMKKEEKILEKEIIEKEKKKKEELRIEKSKQQKAQREKEKDEKIKLREAAQQKREDEKRLKLQKKLKAKTARAEQKEKKKQDKIKERELKKKAVEQKKQEKLKEKELILKKKSEEEQIRLQMEKLAEDILLKDDELALKFKEKVEQKKLKAKTALAEQKEIQRLKKLEEKKKQKTEKKTKKETSKISKEEPEINIKHNINLKQNNSEVLSMDEDVVKFLKIADNLLEKLPDDVIDEFAKSKDFKIYERVINKYKK